MTLTLVTVRAAGLRHRPDRRLFIEFALAWPAVVSGFVALTLTPMMCSVLLRHQSSHSRWYNLIEGWLDALGKATARRWACRCGTAGRWSRWRGGGDRERRAVQGGQERAGADRGPWRGVRHRQRARGRHAELHAGEHAGHRAVLRRHRRGQRQPGHGGLSHGHRRHGHPAAQALGKRNRKQQAITQELQPKFASLPGVRASRPIRRRWASRPAPSRSSSLS